MLVRQIDDTRVTPGGIYKTVLLVWGDWLWLCAVVQSTRVEQLSG